MATNTCASVIEYENLADLSIEPFLSERTAKAEQMFNEGKTAEYPNWDWTEPPQPSAWRYWVDHAAAQEFIDFIVSSAPTYSVNILSTSIQDL